MSKQAKRQKCYELRLKERGLVRRCLWLHEDDWAEIKALVNKRLAERSSTPSDVTSDRS
jgi:hypothetical protein